MNSFIKYASIVLIVFVVSVLLFLPTGKAQRTEDQTIPLGETINNNPDNPNNPQETPPSDEINVPIELTVQPKTGKTLVFVELTDLPLTKIYAAIMAKPGLLKEKRAEASLATRSQADMLIDKQSNMARQLIGRRFLAREIYRVQKALNGIAIEVDAEKIAEIRSLPGVKSVIPIELEYPTNSSSVPFLGTPFVWGSSLGIGPGGLGVKGDNIRIGVIDTGIDYQHATFGGTGALADYQANNRTVAPDTYFPSLKVVGGFDFVGDAYNGGNIPVPDPDPMDCNGHGTHVAGTAAGFGVNADGTTYNGVFNELANFRPLRIGPGTAPGAKLYGLRVFGCGGGTNVTVAAIDWATDPNGDNDLSDHLDVINMSLGSNFGTLTAASAVASDNAVLAGVVVVTSAGNAGDTYFISGAPGSGTRVLATASSVDGGATAAVRMTIAGNPTFFTAGTAAFGPIPPNAGLTNNVVVGLDPADAAGPLTTDGCSPLTNAAAVAGKIALIDRGTCGFTIKVKTAQDAGAVGVIIANNVAGVINMSGDDPTIVIPSVSVSLADGNTIKANLATNPATLYNGGDTLSSFSSRGGRGGGFSTFQLKPDITAPGQTITSAQTGVTCTGSGAGNTGCQVSNATGFISGSQSLILSGTSMASPHMAGIMALLKQLHPDWSVEQLKALAMNGAIHDLTTLPGGNGIRYGLGRIGAGRVDPVNSALLPVTAYNAEEAGVVSLSFNSEVTGNQTQTKKLRVVNSGATSQTFDLGIDTVVNAPGVSFSLPGGNSITVPAGQTVELDVQMSADASQMDHTREGTVSNVQAAPSPINSLGNLFRHWLTEETSYVTFSQGSALKLRVPLYVAPRAASNMSAPATITTGGAGTGSTTIPLSGTDVCTGTLGAGPTCTGTLPTDEVSLVTPFELQVASPRDTSLPGSADLQYAGVNYDPASGLILFGVSTWESWSTPTETSFNIYVDFDQNGTWDRILFNTNPGTAASSLFGNTGANGQDSFINMVFNTGTNGVSIGGNGLYVNRASANVADTALFNSNVMFLAATPAQLGLPGGDTNFRYRIETCPGFGTICGLTLGGHYDAANGPFFWNYNAQGLNFGGGNLFFDLNGATLPVTWNTANMTTNGSLGALLLHHHNGEGKRAEVVVLDTAQSADLGIAYSSLPANPTFGQNITLTLTVNNAGPNAATGVVVTDVLPDGLTYVSDDGVGAYNPATGQWTIGALANSASATLHIVATIDTTDKILTTAQITSGTPLDANPANNQATLNLMSPRQSDLGIAMSVSSPTVQAGNNVSYTLTVTNNGDDPAYSLNVNENFPAYPSLNPSSFTASQGSYNPATGVWNLASLGKGFSATLNVTVTAPSTAGALTLQGTVGAATSDPNNANNTASATTTVIAVADLSVTKTDSPDPVTAGNNLTYSITATNAGPSAAATVTLVDTLPVGTTFVSLASPGGWSCTTPAVGAAGAINCSIASFAVGNGVFTLVVKVGGGTANGTVLSNTATVSSTTIDNNTGNESATATTTVNNTVQFAPIADQTGFVGQGIVVQANATSTAGPVTYSFVSTDGLFASIDPNSGFMSFPTPLQEGKNYTITVRATRGVSFADQIFHVKWIFSFTGFTNPNPNGSSVFSRGANSVVTVKFKLGFNATKAKAKLFIAPAANLGAEAPAKSSDGKTQFVYNATTKEYEFNWSPFPLAAGQYRLRVDLGDGELNTVFARLQ